jgi:hypothetical protein
MLLARASQAECDHSQQRGGPREETKLFHKISLVEVPGQILADEKTADGRA